MKIKLQDAKGYQLREFATKVLGLDVKGTESLEKVRAKIAAAFDGDEIEVSEPEAPAPAGRKINVNADFESLDGEEKVTIILQKNNSPQGQMPVWVGVNGKAIWIPRGEPVQVAKKFVDALDIAEEEIYDALPDGGINPDPRKVPVYPYQRIA